MKEERKAHLALVQLMAESLTVLGNYLGVASSLLRERSPGSRKRLIEVVEKIDAEVTKAGGILQQMRVLLRRE